MNQASKPFDFLLRTVVRALTSLLSMLVGGVVVVFVFMLFARVANAFHWFHGSKPALHWDGDLFYLVIFLVVGPVWLFVFLPLQLVIPAGSHWRRPCVAPLLGLAWLLPLPFSLLLGMAFWAGVCWLLAACVAMSVAGFTQSLLERRLKGVGS